MSTIKGNPLMPRRKTPVLSIAEREDAFLSGMNFLAYNALSDEEKEVFLKDTDAVLLFQVVQSVTHRLGNVKIENYFLYEFLNQNDPRYLIGLEQRRKKAKDLRTRPSGAVRASSMSRHTSTIQMSIVNNLTNKKSVYDYKLNLRAKLDMAEKATASVERRIREIKLNAMRQIRELCVRIDELRYRSEDTQNLSKNFQLHFLADRRDLDFLAGATLREIQFKFHKFVQLWNKNASTLVNTMRLQAADLHEIAQHHRAELVSKVDLSSMLCSVDFDLLTIERDELLLALESKNEDLAGLKGVSGKISLALGEGRHTVAQLETDIKRTLQKITDNIKGRGKFDDEARTLKFENMKALKMLSDLKDQLEHFNAPSVNDYIQNKNELLALEKEEKKIDRSITILTMKLVNTRKKIFKEK